MRSRGQSRVIRLSPRLRLFRTSLVRLTAAVIPAALGTSTTRMGRGLCEHFLLLDRDVEVGTHHELLHTRVLAEHLLSAY